MAGKTKPGIPVKGINIKLRMINDLIDVTGSAKDSWNPAEISDDMKAIAYIHDLADTWNPAQLNEALKYLGFKTVDTWNPAELEETKNKLVKYFLPTDASGNPIELDLKGSLPYEVTALTIDLLPIQDLHGYNSPWVGGAGKNKFNIDGFSDTQRTVVASVNNGVLHLQGTVTAGGNARFALPTTQSVPTGSVTLSVSGSNENIRVVTQGNNGFTYISQYGNFTKTYTITDTVTLSYFYVDVTDGTTVNADVKIQIESGSTATAFAPYSNICPISGRTQFSITTNGETVTVQFGQTVYSGNVNVLEGGTSSTYGYIASYDGEELPGEWLSDRDAYAAGTDPTTGAEVVYMLTTPTELTTPANEIALVNGENTLSTDGDNINITYKAILNS